MSHTPGPWHITRNTVPGQFCTYTKVRDREDGVIAVMHMNEGANARLIASAPELLAALVAIKTQADFSATTFPNAPGMGDFLAIARWAQEAVSKATGGAK